MEKTDIIAVLILTVMFILMLGSVWNDSATMDELAHIPAGFSYITQFDYRLNPEHPPLLKDLAGLSTLIFTRPYFSRDTPAWRNDINGQWDQGREFLYESGNDANRIIFWSRMPLIILTIVFGWFFFCWIRKRFGVLTALLSLIFFAFSPTILTHGRFVTTDVGAALGFFTGLITFIRFIEMSTWRNAALSGLAFGLAQLLKFSLILLIPIYGILFLAAIFAPINLHWHERWRRVLKLLTKIFGIGLMGITLIWLVYVPHVWNYPQERQLRDATFILTSYPIKPLAQFDLALIQNKFTRPLGQYLLGFLMVSQRAGGGNTGYFLDAVSATGSRIYFPLLYLLKEPLAFHILTFIAIWFTIRKMCRTKLSSFSQKLNSVRLWIIENFLEFSALVFILVYWISSIISPLNIGIRHVLPTFPFIYLLVSRKISEWILPRVLLQSKTWRDILKNLYYIYIKAVPKFLIITVLILWFIFDIVKIYPHFMSYYNQLASGSENGYKIAVDSNYDWGQDLIRLRNYVEKNKIDKIALDYFGGGNPRYYLGNKFEPWWSSKGPAHEWFAISATFRQSAFGTPVPGFMRRPEDSYQWLKEYKPVARAGYSIFIYKLP